MKKIFLMLALLAVFSVSTFADGQIGASDTGSDPNEPLCGQIGASYTGTDPCTEPDAGASYFEAFLSLFG